MSDEKNKVMNAEDALNEEQIKKLRELETQFKDVSHIISELEDLIMTQETSYKIHRDRLEKLKFLYEILNTFYGAEKQMVISGKK